MTVALDQINPANFAQPRDLGTDEGKLYLCRTAAYDASREADRGEQERARSDLQKCLMQAASIVDPDTNAQGMAVYSIAESYVDGLASQADSLKLQTATSDATYLNGQRLSNADYALNEADNADTKAAMDAAARGANPGYAYNAGFVGRQVEAGISAGSTAVGKGLTAAIGPKAITAGVLVVLLIGGGIAAYAYFYGRGRGAATGGK